MRFVVVVPFFVYLLLVCFAIATAMYVGAFLLFIGLIVFVIRKPIQAITIAVVGAVACLVLYVLGLAFAHGKTLIFIALILILLVSRHA